MGWFILACILLMLGFLPLVVFLMAWIIPAVIGGFVILGVLALIGSDTTNPE